MIGPLNPSARFTVIPDGMASFVSPEMVMVPHTKMVPLSAAKDLAFSKLDTAESLEVPSPPFLPLPLK